MVGDFSSVSFLMFLWVIGLQWPVFYLSKTKYGQGRSQTPRPECAAWSKPANLSEYLFLKVAERAWDTAVVFFMMWSSSTFLAKQELLDFTQRHLYYMKASTLMASEKEMRGGRLKCHIYQWNGDLDNLFWSFSGLFSNNTEATVDRGELCILPHDWDLKGNFYGTQI